MPKDVHSKHFAYRIFLETCFYTFCNMENSKIQKIYLKKFYQLANVSNEKKQRWMGLECPRVLPIKRVTCIKHVYSELYCLSFFLET